MNKFLLYMVMLLSGLWESLGADIDQLKAILKVRLMLDDRKPMTLGRQQSEGSGAEGLDVVGVGMDGENNTHDARSRGFWIEAIQKPWP